MQSAGLDESQAGIKIAGRIHLCEEGMDLFFQKQSLKDAP